MFTFWNIIIGLILFYIVGCALLLFVVFPFGAYLEDEDLECDSEMIKLSLGSWFVVIISIIYFLVQDNLYIKLSNFVNELYSFLGFRKRK